ncbi:MAG: hypothetical protein KA257_02065 [Opitutaceae bacterium]|nr:hypothetical protein [Opitutaceae bacterium]
MNAAIRHYMALLFLVSSLLRAQPAAQDNWTLEFSFSGASSSGYLNEPRAIASTPDGKLAVVDYGNHRVQVFNTDGSFVFRFGGAGAGDGQFQYPGSIAVAPNGNIIVGDGNHRIQVFDNTGTFVRKWGSQGSGDGQFQWPNGIAVMANGNVVVADSQNHRIQMFSADGTFIRKWGSQGSGEGQFNGPQGVAIAGDGSIVVVDGSRLQMFNADGSFIRQWNGYGFGLAVDAGGKIYVADSSNRRVQIYSHAGSFVNQFGSLGTADGQFRWTGGVAVLPDGRIAVSDPQRHDIQIFTNDGTYQSKFGKYGKGNDGFGQIIAIDFGSDGLVYLADVNVEFPTVQVFTPSGQPVRQLYLPDPGMDKYISPLHMRVGADGRIYASHNGFFTSGSYSAGIYIYENDGTPVQRIGAPTLGSGDGQFMNSTNTIALDTNGDIYVGDSANARVQVFSHDGSFLRKFSAGVNSIALMTDGTIGTVEQIVNTLYLNTYTKSGTFLGAKVIATEALLSVFNDGCLLGRGYRGIAGNAIEVLSPELKLVATLSTDDAYFANVEQSTGRVFVANNNKRQIDVWRRGFRTLGGSPPKLVPMPGVRSVAQRSNGLIDVEYFVTDGDSASVTVSLAAFKGGSSLLREMIPVAAADLREGTSINIGGSIAAGQIHKVTWDPAAASPPAGDLVFEVFARDGRPGLMDIDFIALPAPANVNISRSPITHADMRPAWAWLILNAEPGLTRAGDGEIMGPGGAFTYTYGSGSSAETRTTDLGRAWLFAKLGVREATSGEVAAARLATQSSVPSQFLPVRSQQMGARPARVNEWTFDSSSAYDGEVRWVVKLP